MDAIKRIHEFERFGSVLGLERMEILLDKLGNPHQDLKVIHVAGTNGKGSVCRYLYEALRENGYKAGLYISPFILRFNERIQFDGQDISDEDLRRYTETVVKKAEEMVEEGKDSPTEFEVVTAIAFLYFAKKEADFVILEVGLGGRGDSTNAVERPLISIITSISYDHMAQLGDTLEKIAWEKAGIIKTGAPVVSNAAQREAAAVIARTAYEKGCVLHDATKLRCAVWDSSERGSSFDLEIDGTDYSGVRISMAGAHQVENAKTALLALEILRKQGIIKVTRQRLYRAMEKAAQPGRFEIVGTDPYLILDGAHNEAGAEALKQAMERCFPRQRILMVAGMLADKEIDKIADQFLEITDQFIAAEPDNPRKLPAQKLAKTLRAKGAECECAADAESAVRMAARHPSKPDVILFAGSLYLIGEIKESLKHV